MAAPAHQVGDAKLPAVIRFGIVGLGYIAKKWIHAIETAGHEVAAVASRGKMENAKKYCNLCSKKPTPYDDYDKMMDHPGLNAVYFSLPTALRTEWVLKAIKKKKHVLVEKPMNGVKDVKLMIEAAQNNGVQFMDGVMMMHNPRLQKILNNVTPMLTDQKDESGQVTKQVGEIRAVTSSFATGPMDKTNIRYNPKLEPYGALGDLGWYNIRITLWGFGWKLPKEVRAESNSIEEGWQSSVIENVQVTLFYEDGRIGRFDAEFNNSCMRQWARLVGTKGEVHIPNFVIAKAEDTFSIIQGSWGDFDTKKFDVEDKESVVSVEKNVQEANCIRHFAAAMHKPDKFWPSIALKTQIVLDACFKSFRKGGERVQIQVD
mmetsp:Transcript_38143/g.61956  ORF Transcript_38143/g.61956 Transcript_38143/m.61956 type:complete len:374 (+) Transcript_38143:822-1943(+)